MLSEILSCNVMPTIDILKTEWQSKLLGWRLIQTLTQFAGLTTPWIKMEKLFRVWRCMKRKVK
ncbi:hypothetical protein JT06_00295 [Desulfobulbus sp. Tol-SR]|nr:hypothetical protein JT06_00295 [Desulfobulbus sp. Tol-SR]